MINGFKKPKPESEQKPKGGYHPKKSNGWGAVVGILIAFALAMVMLHRGIRYVALNYNYFDGSTQQQMANPNEAAEFDWPAGDD